MVSSASSIRPFELSSIGEAPYFPITFAAIGVFHITMSIIAAHMLKTGRFSPSLIFTLLAAYPGAARQFDRIRQRPVSTCLGNSYVASDSDYEQRFCHSTSSSDEFQSTLT